MKTEFQKYEATKSSVESLMSYTKHELEKLKENAPDDLYKKTKEFYDFLKSYKVESLRPKPIVLTGDLFDFEPLKEKISKATGYYWEIKEITKKKELEDQGFTKEDFEFRYNLSPDKIRVFNFFRDTNNRSEVWLLNVILIPGKIMLEYSTGRADGMTPFYDSPDKMLKDIHKFF